MSRTRDRSDSARRAAAARWIRQRFGAPVTTDVSGSSRSPPGDYTLVVTRLGNVLARQKVSIASEGVAEVTPEIKLPS